MYLRATRRGGGNIALARYSERVGTKSFCQQSVRDTFSHRYSWGISRLRDIPNASEPKAFVSSRSETRFYCAAETIAVNASVLRDAPPIRPPSMFSFARRSAAFLSFMDPPYWMMISLAAMEP